MSEGMSEEKGGPKGEEGVPNPPVNHDQAHTGQRPKANLIFMQQRRRAICYIYGIRPFHVGDGNNCPQGAHSHARTYDGSAKQTGEERRNSWMERQERGRSGPQLMRRGSIIAHI